MARIVIISRTESTGHKVAEALRSAGHDVSAAESMSHGANADVVFAEPAVYADGAVPADVPVVMLATADTVAAATDAVRAGAYDVLRVPAAAEEIELTAWRAQRCRQTMRENQVLRAQLSGAAGDGDAATSSMLSDALAAAARNLAGTPLADIEKQVILRTLEQFKGHRLRTAAALGIGVRTLGMKIKRWREEGEPIAGRQHRPPVHVDVS